jgi:diphthamide synthase (EF-2-diphthine--ammonia ligase)
MIYIPSPCSNEHYESARRLAITEAKGQGVEGVAFGDLFLEDIRAYREAQLSGTGLDPIFPLWKMPTRDLAERMIEAGLQSGRDMC